MTRRMLACRITGHKIHFTADGATMRWTCERGCGTCGEKVYDTPADAARYAAAFNRKDSDKVGTHPTLSTVPLWFARKLRAGRR